MTDTREKLIELQKNNCVPGKKCYGDCLACMADHLIANGVTIAANDDFPDNLTEQAYCNGKAAMREAVIEKLMNARTVARGADHALLADIIQMVRDLEV